MLTGLEFPLLRTTIDLVWRPGVVAEAWSQGKRRTYASPIKFCLIAGVVITLVLPMLNARPIAPGRLLGAIEEFITRSATNYFAFFAMVVLIPLALTMALMSRLRAYRSPLEWYALGLYVIGISVVLQLVFAVVQLTIPGIPPVAGTFPVVFYLLGAWGFAEHGKRLRSLLACLLGFTALVAASVVIA